VILSPFISKYFSFEEGYLRAPDNTILNFKNFPTLVFKAQETIFMNPDLENPGKFIETKGWILHPLNVPKEVPKKEG